MIIEILKKLVGNLIYLWSYVYSFKVKDLFGRVLLGRKVMVNDTSHGGFIREQLDIQPNLRPLCSKGPIVIEENVWIGEMVCILGNVHIGRGSVIGAGSVVTKDIPPYSLAVGCPAKIIKSFDK